MTRMRKNRFIILTLAMTVLLSGCFGNITKYRISSPLAAKEYSRHVAAIVKVPISSNFIYVTPINDQVRSSYDQPLGLERETYPEYIFNSLYWKQFNQKGKPPFFLIEVFLDIKEESYSFSPNVLVSLDSGKRIKQSECFFYPNPHKPYKANILHVVDYKSLEASGEPCGETYKLKAGQRMAFLIKFDIAPPEPGAEFSIIIGDMFKSEKPLDLPKLKYQGAEDFKIFQS